MSVIPEDTEDIIGRPVFRAALSWKRGFILKDLGKDVYSKGRMVQVMLTDGTTQTGMLADYSDYQAYHDRLAARVEQTRKNLEEIAELAAKHKD